MLVRTSNPDPIAFLEVSNTFSLITTLLLREKHNQTANHIMDSSLVDHDVHEILSLRLPKIQPKESSPKQKRKKRRRMSARNKHRHLKVFSVLIKVEACLNSDNLVPFSVQGLPEKTNQTPERPTSNDHPSLYAHLSHSPRYH